MDKKESLVQPIHYPGRQIAGEELAALLASSRPSEEEAAEFRRGLEATDKAQRAAASSGDVLLAAAAYGFGQIGDDEYFGH